MRAYDIIYKKREGKKLSEEEISFLIKGYVNNEIPDYQLSAWAMAVFFQGMDAEETAHLTMSMARSGDMIDLSPIKGVKVDKHSTGGVGDTTTLVLAPLVAAAGIPVAKMSGRGLGHTGGTIDKLEAISNFNTSLSREDFINNVNQYGVAVVGQTGNLTPADKKLYSLRDVTATVDSIPLIASSIMSKKIAGGADGIVLDVKIGSGAFMKEISGARELARTMVDIGNEVGRKTRAVITDMNQPLGFAVGNALEVKEAIATLQGKGPADLTELCLTLGANMLYLAGNEQSTEKARTILEKKLNDGSALNKFKELIIAQGGDAAVIDNPELLATADLQIELKSEKAGYISEINALEVGLTAMLLGAGRETKDDNIKMDVGIMLNKKYGDQVKAGEVLATLHLDNNEIVDQAKERLRNSFSITDEKQVKRPLIYEIID